MKIVQEKEAYQNVGIARNCEYDAILTGSSMTENFRASQFDKLFELVKKNQYCIKQLDYILLDEAQDTDENQFEFILDMINPKKFFIVGDHRQLIYSFSMKKTDCFINLAKNKEIKVYNYETKCH